MYLDSLRAARHLPLTKKENRATIKSIFPASGTIHDDPICTQHIRNDLLLEPQATKVGTCGLVAMTSASHAEGRQFDPGQVYLYFSDLDMGDYRKAIPENEQL